MLLSNTDMPLIDIVNEIGVGTQQYLNSLFKKYTGFTPKKYREFYYNNRAARYEDNRYAIPNIDDSTRLHDERNEYDFLREKSDAAEENKKETF